MSSEHFIGKPVVVRSTDEKGKITEILRRRGGGGALSVRYIVKLDDSDTRYEVMPHEIKFEDTIANG